MLRPDRTLSKTITAVGVLQLLRDAEMLTASEVAQLPVTLLQLYKQRSAKEQQTVATHAFFDILVKPWALEPSKLSTQVSYTAKLTSMYLSSSDMFLCMCVRLCSACKPAVQVTRQACIPLHQWLWFASPQQQLYVPPEALLELTHMPAF